MIKKHNKNLSPILMDSETTNNKKRFSLKLFARQHIVAVPFVIVFVGLGVYFLSASLAEQEPVATITNFINPSEATNFRDRSFYDIPERGYLNTVPATTLLNAVGASGLGSNRQDVNTYAGESQVDHLLADEGFSTLRIQKNWCDVDYANQNEFDNLTGMTNSIDAMKQFGLRPLVIVEAYDSCPDPSTTIKGSYTQTPKVGDSVVHVPAAIAAQLQGTAGRSGISSTGRNGKMINYIFTNINPNGTLTLSRPLGTNANLNGNVVISEYAPFQKPFLPGNKPNPAFQQTMNGWLQYMKDICTTTKSILGSDQFDVEVWNELLSDNAYLSTRAYYVNPPDANDTGSVQQQILAQTGAWFSNPANGCPDVQLSDGFASQVPWPSSSTTPAGIDALSKHDYDLSQRVYPADLAKGGATWINALNQKDTPPWGPNTVVHLPEIYLTGMYNQENSMFKDLSTITTYIGKTPHGESVKGEGGQKVSVWETEWNTNLVNDPNGLQGTPRPGDPGIYYFSNPADPAYILAKSYIRYISSMVNKGLGRVYLEGPLSGTPEKNWISTTFINDVQNNPNVYPGDATGGEVTDVLGRFMHSFSGAQTITKPRSITLNELDDYSGNIQFKGDGTAAHPNLYDRDMFGFFPYQLTNNSFVIPMYIQTLDIEKIYNKNAPDPTQFDMPPETYQLTIGGINGNNIKSISMYDPLTNVAVPVTVVSGTNDTIVIQVPITDSPRLLTVEDSGNTGNGNGNGHVAMPTVTFTEPTNNQSVDGKVTIESTATSDPSTTVASVYYTIDGKKIVGSGDGILNTSPYELSFNASNYKDGPHTLTATVQDGLGNTASTSETIVVSGVIQKPTINFLTPAHSTGAAGTLQLTTEVTVDPSLAVQSVQYLLDGNPLSGLLNTAPYTYSWNTKQTPDGVHELRATVTDSSGATDSATLKIDVKN